MRTSTRIGVLTSLVLAGVPLGAQRAGGHSEEMGFRPSRTNAESGSEALRGFVPAVSPVERGGRCVTTATEGTLRTVVTAWPAFTEARTVVIARLDGARLLGSDKYRFERPVAIPTTDEGEIGRALNGDSVRAMRHMLVRLDYVGSQMGTIWNDYAHRSGVAARVEPAAGPRSLVYAPLRDVEAMSRLGNVTARARRAVALCEREPPRP